jgi:hypothetical protein
MFQVTGLLDTDCEASVMMLAGKSGWFFMGYQRRKEREREREDLIHQN